MVYNKIKLAIYLQSHLPSEKVANHISGIYRISLSEP